MQDYLVVTRSCPPTAAATPTARTGCCPRRRLGARGRRLAQAVGRLQDADARPRRVRGRRVAQPGVPPRERRRHPDGRRGPPHRPHACRAVRRGAGARHHGRRAAPSPASSSSTRRPARRGFFVDDRGCRRSRVCPFAHAAREAARRRRSARGRRRTRVSGASRRRTRWAATCCSTACGSSSSASPRWCPRCARVLSELGADVIKIESRAPTSTCCAWAAAASS